jgi:putative addiction module component (TIGR02574 family)
MSPIAEELFELVSKLPTEERAEIAQRLNEPDENDPKYQAWWAEIERRMQAVDDGTMELIDSDVVFARLRAKLDAKVSA